MTRSNNNTFANNTANSNTNCGIYLHGLSNNNTIVNNTISSNNDDGINMDDSSYNIITNNNILNNSRGVYLDHSSNNTVTNNSVSLNRGNGIGLEDSADNNTIIGNTISSNNNVGIYIELCNNNWIYHNNFINNGDPAYDDRSNFWDNGYPSGGNYWGDHTCTGNPSDGSQPYHIDADSIDHWPFEDPIGKFPPFPLPQPKAEISVHKEEYLSTNDTHIDRNQIYNFTTMWDAYLWNVENLDNVSYTITTSKDLTYMSTWEYYPNGSETSFILPPVIEGQTYTWLLLLKDRIGSNINFVLEPSQTVQGNPWADMDMDTTNEEGYTRLNVTFMPATPLDWIFLRVIVGDLIVDVSAYPPEFEIMLTSSRYVMFSSGDINQDQVYNFSVLVDNPTDVRLLLDSSCGWVVESPSDAITLPVADLGSVTVTAGVPVIWGHRPAQPQYVQVITINMDGWLTQKGAHAEGAGMLTNSFDGEAVGA